MVAVASDVGRNRVAITLARGRSLVGVYLWKSKADADRLYTADWVAMVTKRWGAAPLRQEWETPMVVESAEKRLVEAA